MVMAMAPAPAPIKNQRLATPPAQSMMNRMPAIRIMALLWGSMCSSSSMGSSRAMGSTIT